VNLNLLRVLPGIFDRLDPISKCHQYLGVPRCLSWSSRVRVGCPHSALLLGDVPRVTSHVEPTEMTNFSTNDSFGASQPLFGNVTVTLYQVTDLLFYAGICPLKSEITHRTQTIPFVVAVKLLDPNYQYQTTKDLSFELYISHLVTL
jgi:hypothetical protein